MSGLLAEREAGTESALYMKIADVTVARNTCGHLYWGRPTSSVPKMGKLVVLIPDIKLDLGHACPGALTEVKSKSVFPRVPWL